MSEASEASGASEARTGARVRVLSLVVAFLILVYFVVYASAHLTLELTAAIAVEVVVFVISIAGGIWQAKSKQGRLQELVLHTLTTAGPRVRFFRNLGEGAVLFCWFAVIGALCFDLTGLLAGYCGNSWLARNIYTSFPAYAATGLHPAWTLEALSGAYIEDKNYKRAGAICDDLIAIRRKLYGPNSVLYASILKDAGDVKKRGGDFAGAEALYRQSLNISRRLFDGSNMGMLLTNLATVLRAQGPAHYREAEQFYLEALRMRAKQFGKDSARVAQTLDEYASFLAQSGREAEARRCRRQMERINALLVVKSKPEPRSSDILFIVLAFIFSCLISRYLFGARGLLTGLAVRLLEAKLSVGRGALSTDAAMKLISFYELRENAECARVRATIMARLKDK